jgi:DNA-binding NarL/FixJ family response regulator
VFVDRSGIAVLRTQGMSWAKIADSLELGEGTVRRAAQSAAKNLAPKTAS